MGRKGRTMMKIGIWLGVIAAGAAAFSLNGCSSTIPRQDPVGETFPTVQGRSLEEEPVTMPDEFAGEPAVLLIGYKQRAQFDIDRWLLGLLQAEVDARLVEIPTIPGLVPTIASGWIDEGMRSGIPPEDWGSVVTLYGSDARPVAELTGTEEGQVARVIVLDRDGTVVWFDDEGYSARKALEVKEVVEGLRERPLTTPPAGAPSRAPGGA